MQLRSFLIVAFVLVIAPLALAHPGSGIAVTSDGRVFFVDTGRGIFSIERDGRVVHHDGPPFHWFAFDPTSAFRQTRWPSIPNGELRAVGQRPTLVMSSDLPVAIGTDGKFYYPERIDGDLVRINGVAPSGVKSARAVLPPVQSAGRTVPWVNGLAAGPNGSLYYTENKTVRKIDANGRVSVIAANVAVPNCTVIPQMGPELRPYLRGMAVTADGTVYVAATGCGALLKIAPRGAASVVLRTSAPWSPTAVAVANGEIYVLEYLHTESGDRTDWTPRVRKISRTGAVTALGTSKRK